MLKVAISAMILAQAASAALAQSPLTANAAAPDFALKDQSAAEARLSDYLGQKTVVLVFIVAAFGGSDAIELQNYQAASAAFDEAGAKVIAVSLDSIFSNREFARQTAFTLPLLSDWKRTAASAYGVYKEDAGFPQRATFIIDKTGVIKHVLLDRDAMNAESALALCRSLNGG